MAVSFVIYSHFLTAVGNEEVDLAADTFKITLTTASYTPDQNAHDYLDDITDECTGAGFARLTLTNIAATLAAKVLTFDADDADFGVLTLDADARYAPIWDDTPGTDGTRPLVGYVDFGAGQAASGQNFSIAWPATGIFTATVP